MMSWWGPPAGPDGPPATSYQQQPRDEFAEFVTAAKANLKKAIEWSEFLLGGSASLCLSTNRSAGPDDTMHKMRDLLVPAYFPTTIPELELSRDKMVLSLTGQIVVVSCRLLTGHFGGAMLGAVIFVVGNQARCSVQSRPLNMYVVMGSVVGLLDAADLTRHAVDSIFMSGGMGLGLMEKTALLLAPVAELSGARFAFGSYIRPEMLFAASVPTPAAAGCGHAAARLPAPSFYPSFAGNYYYPPAANMPGPGAQHMAPRPSHPRSRTESEASSSTRSRTRREEQNCNAQPWYQRLTGLGLPTFSAEPEEQRATDVADLADFEDSRSVITNSAHASESAEGPQAHGGSGGLFHRPVPQQQQTTCSICSEAFVVGYSGWMGTGRFSNSAYCEHCWHEWRSESSYSSGH
eukprot:TRINITY_DN15844_c1_g2_i1.p1 TRINITY_DN15844_c1_g2~~TRINITY_DN15844_c1_g2_i1.p1  ORF type:complete len:406 (-),score=46.33 TRINITY_DN15844_c1_g2_i1:8-1225(-)